jgi:tetratricopeptide (TPR) repeat protein
MLDDFARAKPNGDDDNSYLQRGPLTSVFSRSQLVLLVVLTMAGTAHSYAAGAADAAKTSPVVDLPKPSTSDEGRILSATEIEKLLGGKNVGYAEHYQAGRFFESKGLTDQAIDHYKMAAADAHAQPNAYKHLAQVYLAVSHPEKADATVKDAIKRFPDDFGLRLTAGYVYHNEHKLEDAVAMYKKAASLRPDNKDVQLAAADVLNDLEKPQAALPYVEKATAGGHASEFAYYEKAKTLIKLRRNADALEPLSHNFATNPFNYKSGKFYSSLLFTQKDYKKALEVSLCMLPFTVGPDMDDVKTIALGCIARLRGADVLAVARIAESKIKDDKHKAILHFALGDIYDKANHPDEAMAQYKQGLVFNPRFGRGYLRLGEDLEAKKDLKGAAENYEKAFQFNPKDQEIVSRRDKLKNSGK